tara:strand:+ start:6602 stop:7258 length:657 start_codon:yes stop_codon:yes gene_type:complete
MKGVNLIISAVFWFVLISLMSIDWLEVGKVILIVVAILFALLFVFALLPGIDQGAGQMPNSKFKQDRTDGMINDINPINFRDKVVFDNRIVEQGIIIDEPWIEKILTGEKTWEMRSKRTPKRGTIALIKKGTKTVVGIAELYGCDGPLSKDELRNTMDRHRIPERMFNHSSYKWFCAWKLRNVHKLKNPVSYEHKKGSTVWVNLDYNAIDIISRTLDA